MRTQTTKYCTATSYFIDFFLLLCLHNHLTYPSFSQVTAFTKMSFTKLCLYFFKKLLDMLQPYTESTKNLNLFKGTLNALAWKRAQGLSLTPN